jgi:hypothetical protein
MPQFDPSGGKSIGTVGVGAVTDGVTIAWQTRSYLRRRAIGTDVSMLNPIDGPVQPTNSRLANSAAVFRRLSDAALATQARLAASAETILPTGELLHDADTWLRKKQ